MFYAQSVGAVISGRWPISKERFIIVAAERERQHFGQKQGPYEKQQKKKQELTEEEEEAKEEKEEEEKKEK